MNLLSPENPIDIRPATTRDVPVIYSFIRALADYEHLLDQVQATEANLFDALFGENPCAEAFVAFYGNAPAGFALIYTTFSTFVGRPGIYLEDLYVKPELRGKGIGSALLRQIAQVAIERRSGRVEWAALDWNEPAIRFYKNLGARSLDEWTVFRMTEETFKPFAQED